MFDFLFHCASNNTLGFHLLYKRQTFSMNSNQNIKITRNDLLLTLSEMFLSSKESGMLSASTLLATVPVRASDTPPQPPFLIFRWRDEFWRKGSWSDSHPFTILPTLCRSSLTCNPWGKSWPGYTLSTTLIRSQSINFVNKTLRELIWGRS